MICDIIRIPLRKFIVKVVKGRDEITTAEVVRSIAKDNEELGIEELGVLLSKLPKVKSVELTSWSQDGIIIEVNNE